MRQIFLLLAIAVLFSCNQQSNTTDSGTGNETNTSANAGSQGSNDVSTDMIQNPSTAENPTAEPAAYPIITFKNDFYDFGDMLEGQVVETTFEFKNTGKADLLINRCDATCGCTVPDWPKDPIKPGETGKIKVKFDSAGKSGVNNKIVTVVANIKGGSTELKFRANVQAAKKAE
jgi:hypothetical protein